MREPAFWWRAAGVAPAVLAPFAALYGAVASRRLARPGARAGVPVVCIGNLTVGGAGKTPAAMTVVRMLAEAGETPMLLSRGYGGACLGPLRVDPARHRARDVGDEPLLLAAMAATFGARDRVKGAAAAAAAGASVIVMDDGFQNPSLTKDCSVLVLDARRGIGNGKMIPAGPLRAPLDAQLDRAAALVVVGAASGAAPVAATARARGLPVFQAHMVPDADVAAALARTPVLAFAGIGDPEKLFASLAGAGVTVAATRSFPDHHRYTGAQARALCAAAERGGLTLVTTEKDLARLQGERELAGLAARARALPVTLALDDPASFMGLLRHNINAARARLRGVAPDQPLNRSG
jgi:tetraacyldisaccharide 4'-kinase